MGRIIIDYDDRFRPEAVLDAVAGVVEGGRISCCSTGDHFCWVTVYKIPKMRVITRQRKQGQKSDSFIVEKIR